MAWCCKTGLLAFREPTRSRPLRQLKLFIFAFNCVDRGYLISQAVALVWIRFVTQGMVAGLALRQLSSPTPATGTSQYRPASMTTKNFRDTLPVAKCQDSFTSTTKTPYTDPEYKIPG